MNRIFVIIFLSYASLLYSQNVGVSDNNSQPQTFFHLHSQNYTNESPLFQITNNLSGNTDSTNGFNINFNNDFNTQFVNNYQNDSARFSFFTKDNLPNTSTERLTLANNGNIGVGTDRNES